MPPSAAVTRGAALVWLGDFLDEGAIESLRGMARAGIRGHLVRIVDPAEEDFPYHGRARFESVRGSGRNIEEGALFGRAESVGDAYRARFRAHGEILSDTAMRLGWTCTTHRTDHAPLRALIALHAAIGMA